MAGEVEILVKKYGVYEIFDDNESGAVWNTAWMQEFLVEIEKRGIKGKFVISSNARAENLTEEKCALMKKIGYRLLKVGLESGDTATLHRIGKLEKIEDLAIPALSSSTRPTYQDSHKISPASRPAVEFLTRLGLIVGNGKKQFNPDQPLTRAEAAALLHRLNYMLDYTNRATGGPNKKNVPLFEL